MGPSSPHGTLLRLAEEAKVVEFRRRTLLPLDDVLGCLRDGIPKLTRSSLHRCFDRHGISRLPENPGQACKRGKFDATAIGYLHIEIGEPHPGQGELDMVLAIDWVFKVTDIEFRDDAGEMNGRTSSATSAFSYAIHTVLPDHGMAFADLPKTATGRAHDVLAPASSTASAMRTASSTNSPSHTTRGPMVRPNA